MKIKSMNMFKKGTFSKHSFFISQIINLARVLLFSSKRVSRSDGGWGKPSMY